MTISRKRVALAAVLLAFAIVSPITASAKVNEHSRPFRSAPSGTVTLNVRSGELEGDLIGTGSHIGLYSMHIEGSGSFAQDGTFSATGTWFVIVANGDELSGTMTATTSAFTEAGHTATIDMTVTSGTGRFEDAGGMIKAFNVLTVLSFDGEHLVQHSEVTATGRISY